MIAEIRITVAKIVAMKTHKFGKIKLIIAVELTPSISLEQLTKKGEQIKQTTTSRSKLNNNFLNFFIFILYLQN